MKKISLRMRILLSLFFGCYSSLVLGANYQQEIDSAVNWLISKQQIDGSWGSVAGLKPIFTSEALLALRNNAKLNPGYYKGVTWLENHAGVNNDVNARRLLALYSHGDDITGIVTILTQAQKTGPVGQGGWGVSNEYESSALDTSLSLQSLSGLMHNADIQAALNFLKTSQLSTSNYGWALSLETSSDPSLTAIVVLGLLPYVSVDPQLTTVINNAINGLETTVTSSSPLLTRALTALALLKTNSSSSTGLTMLDDLVNTQELSGSWGEDIYITSIILRTIAVINGTAGANSAKLVQFNDANLRTYFTSQLGKNRFDGITKNELLEYTNLNFSGMNISDLTGLGEAVNLSTIDLTGTNVTSLIPLAGLDNITQIIFQGNTLTSSTDIDNDGLNDLLEVNLGISPFLTDSDGDGLSDNDEINIYGTDPRTADTDGDGLEDADELNFYATNPLDGDSDDDGLNDGEEINVYNTSPLLSDTDSDGLSDGDEIEIHGTDPLVTDTDNGGKNDGLEITLGRNPLNPGDDIFPDILPAIMQILFD